MKLHTDTLSYADLRDAATIARVQMDATRKGSRSRAHAWDVKLEGESRRRPNSGRYGFSGDDAYAATWDQWGVFLAVLFDRDPKMSATYYADAATFHAFTATRFADRQGEVDYATTPQYWPADAHGDHTFRYEGGRQACTKCSATQNHSLIR